MRWWLAAVFVAIATLTAVLIAAVSSRQADRDLRANAENIAVGASISARSAVEQAIADGTLEEQLRHKMLSRYRAHGLLGGSGGGDVFNGLGPAKPDPSLPEYPGRTALREGLVAEGALVPVEVEGVRGKRLVLQEELALLEDPPEPLPSVAFLPPFDALVWDRALLGSLFDFDYVWELFHPPARRRWGWYVLPILFRDRLVGRIEPRIDREAGRVHVLNVWWEDGFAPRRAEGFVDAMRDALRAYLRFANVTRIGWAPTLAAEKRLFLTRP